MSVWLRLSHQEEVALRRLLLAASSVLSGHPDTDQMAEEAGQLLTRLDHYAEKLPNAEAYRSAVEISDDLEVDPDALVSMGDDAGAFVHAWVWVSDEKAGVESEEPEPEG